VAVNFKGTRGLDPARTEAAPPLQTLLAPGRCTAGYTAAIPGSVPFASDGSDGCG